MGAGAVFGHELFDGLEKVHMEAGQVVDAGELGIGASGREAIVADELADDGAVLLLDVSAVVFLPGAAAGEGDAMLPAVGIEVLVDELAAVVAVEAHEWHGQSRADAMNAAADALLAFAPDRFELDPGRGDIDGTEGGEIEALGARGTVGNEIDLEEARPGIVRLGEGANGDLWLEPGAGLSDGGPAERVRARAGASRRASVGRLAWRSCLSRAGGRVSSPYRVRRSSSSPTKGCSRWAPIRPL